MRDKADNFSIVFNEFLKAYLPSDKEPQAIEQKKSDELHAARASDIAVPA